MLGQDQTAPETVAASTFFKGYLSDFRIYNVSKTVCPPATPFFNSTCQACPTANQIGNRCCQTAEITTLTKQRNISNVSVVIPLQKNSATSLTNSELLMSETSLTNTSGKRFSTVFPDDLYNVHLSSLHVVVTLSNGDPLPSSITYNQETRTLEGNAYEVGAGT